MVLSTSWWALYRSCLRSTWLWKRGCFLTGSSGPNCGETTLSTGVEESEKIKGLNTDLPGCGWCGLTGRETGKRESKRQKLPPTHEKQSSGGKEFLNIFTMYEFKFEMKFDVNEFRYNWWISVYAISIIVWWPLTRNASNLISENFLKRTPQLAPMIVYCFKILW